MSAAIPEIAGAIESALKTIPGLRTAPYLSDSVTPPMALVAIEDVTYHGAFGYSDVVHTFTVFVIVGRASDRAGLTAMEGFMSSSGPTSIRAAIEADPTLGEVVSTLVVEKSGPPTQLAIGQSGAVYVSVPFTVTVHA